MAVELKKAGFAFSEVAEILAEMLWVSPTKVETFKSRLQQLQKAGLPAGASKGRGAKIRYQSWQIADLAAMLELLDLGIPPGILSEFYGSVDGREGRGIYSYEDNGVRIQDSLNADVPDLYALVQFNALKYLRVNDALINPASDDSKMYGSVFPNLVVASDLPEAVGALEKAGVINMTQHLRRLRSAVEAKFPDRLEDITLTLPAAAPQET